MRVLIGDLLTGRRILDVPYLSADWAVELNGAGTVSCAVDLRDPDVQSLDLRSSAALGKTFLAVLEGDRFLSAGPIWSRTYDRATGELSLKGAGLWSYFDHRVLLPNVGDLPVIDPDTGESAAHANSSWSGLHLGTIGKRIIEQSLTWPGGGLPIVFEADKPGDHERNYLGAELPLIGEMLQNLTEVENGPDIAFVPEWTDDRLGVRWRYVSGDPRLSSSLPHRVDASVVESPLEELTVDESAARMGALGWASGGRQGDEAMVERALNAQMLDHGFPLMERVDSSRSSVTEPATLQAYAGELARTGGRPVASWGASVHTGGEGEPAYTAFTVGDYVDIKVGGDLFIPDDRYRRRIVNMSGSAGDPVVKLGLGEDYG